MFYCFERTIQAESKISFNIRRTHASQTSDVNFAPVFFCIRVTFFCFYAFIQAIPIFEGTIINTICHAIISNYIELICLQKLSFTNYKLFQLFFNTKHAPKT